MGLSPLETLDGAGLLRPVVGFPPPLLLFVTPATTDDTLVYEQGCGLYWVSADEFHQDVEVLEHDAIMVRQGICSSGSHIPPSTELTVAVVQIYRCLFPSTSDF